MVALVGAFRSRASSCRQSRFGCSMDCRSWGAAGGTFCGLASPRIQPQNGSQIRSRKHAGGNRLLAISFVTGTGSQQEMPRPWYRPTISSESEHFPKCNNDCDLDAATLEISNTELRPAPGSPCHDSERQGHLNIRTVGIYVFLFSAPSCARPFARVRSPTFLTLPRVTVLRRLQEMVRQGYVERVGNACRGTNKVNISDLKEKLQRWIDMIVETAKELSKFQTSPDDPECG